MLESAMSYAERGLCVFPCAWIEDGACSCRDPECESPGKHPLTPHGLLDATNDVDQVRDFWTKFPKANVAIRTGAESNIAVIDVDDVDVAKPELDKLIPGYDFKSVPSQKTGNGWHFVFTHPGVPVKNGTKFLPGMDSRGDGGYIIAAPSTHISGKQYEWKKPLNGTVLPLPAALLIAINRTSSNGHGEPKPTLDTSIVWEGIPDGQRDDTLFRYACKMRQNDTPRELAERLIFEAAARCKPAFSERTALAKVEQAYQKYSPGENSSTEWPAPQPIRASLHPVDAFDARTLLPPSLSAWILDEADRMPCPPDFIAAGALVALGAIIGARCTVKPKSQDDWLIVPNVWGAIVGLPSAKKSPAIGAALKPLDRLIAKAMEAQSKELEEYESKKTVHAAQKEALEFSIKQTAKGKPSNGSNGSTLSALARELQDHQKDAPKEPILRRYKTNDTTVEKLGELLRENPAGLMVLRDEIVGLLASWDREGREGERAFFLEAWNGNQSFDTDRIGRGSIFIPNLCVSIFGGIQPDKLTAYLEQAEHALANDGMLQRFQILLYPDHRAWEWRDRYPSRDARNSAFSVFESLAEFDPVRWGATPADAFIKFPHFRFDDAAQEVYVEWSADLHAKRIPAEDHQLIAQHLTKYDKLFPALALILHLAECADTGRRGAITKEAALRAAAWCEFLEKHARRSYGLLIDDGLRAAQALADKVKAKKLPNGFTARDVRRNQWRYLTSDDLVQSAVDWLADEHWLRGEDVGGTGKGPRAQDNPLLDQSRGVQWLIGWNGQSLKF